MSNRILAVACRGTLVISSFVAVCLGSPNRPVAGESIELGSVGAVAGRVADMKQQTQTMGQTFNIGFNGISYDGSVHRAVIEDATPEGLLIKLALRDVSLTINSIQIDSKRRGAQCGPMLLKLGTERELWVTFKVKRTLEDGKARLTVQDADFDLASDNWRIGSPSWVRSWGLGMTESRVVSGLRSGLASNREAIEWQLGEESAAMFSQVEEHLLKQLASQPQPVSARLASRQGR